jgi:hypothetical protein
MQLQTASEMRAWRSVGRLSGLQPSASIWAWSWDPLRFARRHPPHHLSPARQIARQGTTPEVAQPPSSHHSNAPIGPECQSIPSNIVAHPYQSFRAFAQHGSCSAALRGGFWRCCTCGTGVRISSGAPVFLQIWRGLERRLAHSVQSENTSTDGRAIARGICVRGCRSRLYPRSGAGF